MLKARPARCWALRRRCDPDRPGARGAAGSPGAGFPPGPLRPVQHLPARPATAKGFAWSPGADAAAWQPALGSIPGASRSQESPGSARPFPGPTALRPWPEAAPLSSPPLPRGSLAREVQRMELYFSPERSGREGTRLSPSYRFCCLLSEPATSIQEQTEQQNRPATVIYTA